ncbi:histidine kinase [Castellaniella caeni]|uniref:histidine kinase n=1 Tax=Castellaniella caeni TaxID=266123 RepID=UPI000833DDF8|nr:histidine kinase [Castellaniella caeni]
MQAPQPSYFDTASPRNRLSTRIICTTAVVLLLGLGMIGWTLWLSWLLEGAGAAINNAGSLRMRANQVAIALQQEKNGAPPFVADTDTLLQAQAQMLEHLRAEEARHSQLLPKSPAIQMRMTQVATLWNTQLAPRARRVQAGAPLAVYLDHLNDFVTQADQLVRAIEADSARKTSRLRFSQATLIVMACAATLALVWLLYVWIIHPVRRLQGGLRGMAQRDFNLRLPVDRRDEFGVLAVGFNRMADELQSLYTGLEARVAEKTAQLANQNATLATLYDMAAFLNRPNDIETVCKGFLDRILQRFQADSATLQLSGPPGSPGTHTTLSVGCTTSHAASDQARFPVRSHEEDMGSFALFFAAQRLLDDSQRHLLETLGQHLGIAIQNRRLSSQARQLAMEQERSLVAQGLHDSIAQGLNFLKLQLQLLDRAAQRGDLAEIDEIIPLLRTGVDESYQDVRELLNNFRSQLGDGGLLDAAEETVARFRRQTGIEVALRADGLASGPPLTRVQQLEALFILQEALSNVRKHAEASKVEIHLSNRQGFRMSISDDGIGCDPGALENTRTDDPIGHVGLRIMQERARRMGARLNISAAPGQGVAILLALPAERQAPA